MNDAGELSERVRPRGGSAGHPPAPRRLRTPSRRLGLRRVRVALRGGRRGRPRSARSRTRPHRHPRAHRAGVGSQGECRPHHQQQADRARRRSGHHDGDVHRARARRGRRGDGGERGPPLRRAAPRERSVVLRPTARRHRPSLGVVGGVARARALQSFTISRWAGRDRRHDRLARRRRGVRRFARLRGHEGSVQGGDHRRDLEGVRWRRGGQGPAGAEDQRRTRSASTRWRRPATCRKATSS